MEDKLFPLSLGKPKSQFILLKYSVDMHRIHDDSACVDFIHRSLCKRSLYRLRAGYAIDDPCDGIRRNSGLRDQCIGNVAYLGTPDTFLYVNIDFWIHVFNDVSTRRQTR